MTEYHKQYYIKNKEKIDNYNKEWRRNNRSKYKYLKDSHYYSNKESIRNSDLLRDYGISLAVYKEMFNAQNEKCRICCLRSVSSLHVDHCHKTGKVRGLLCGNCNRALGLFKDDQVLLQEAIKYLKREN